MNEIQRKILEVLNNEHNNPKTADQIVSELNLPFDRTNVSIRNEIKYLRRYFNQLIGSSNEGFFMITEKEDLNVTLRHLKSRFRETNLIVDKLRENFNNQ